MAKTKRAIQVYADGSYDWQRKVGGYGAVIFMKANGKNHVKKLVSTVSYVNTTHNRMEVRAVLASLKRINPGHVIDVYTDSKYCVIMFNNIQKTTYRIRTAKNPDLWKQVRDQWIEHVNKGSYITINWIRGHSGNTFNELADRLANKGCNRNKKVKCTEN